MKILIAIETILIILLLIIILNKKPANNSSPALSQPNLENLSFAWPVEGNLSKPSWGNMAVEFRDLKDASVKSVEKGIVEKVDCSNPQQGCSIIIDHGNYIFSEYDNNKEALVKPGDEVQKGQQIAISGKVSTFSLYYDNKIIFNPLQYLSK